MKTAMILAAGRGERLRPLTFLKPKAMCLVSERPLIEHHVCHLRDAGFERIVINHAYLGGQIRQYFGNGRAWDIEILYSPEPTGGLETGGGIVNALPLLGKETFVTINADIFTNFAYGKINIPPSSLAHLVLVPNPGHNKKGDFSLGINNSVNNNREFTLAGINWYHPEFFSGLHAGRYSVVPHLRRLVDLNVISGELFHGLWIDIGSQQRLDEANEVGSK